MSGYAFMQVSFKVMMCRKHMRVRNFLYTAFSTSLNKYPTKYFARG